MKKFQKPFALLLAVLMLVGLLAGCNTNPGNTDPEPTMPTSKNPAAWDTSKNDEIIVTVINGYYTAGERKLAEEYMKLHPETKVTIDVVADNDSYSLKMQTIMANPTAAGTSDIVHSNFYASVAGGASAVIGKQLFDMSTILDMDHPYQDGKVRDMYDETVILEMVNASGGVGMQALPFDKCGISFYYNKDMFAQYNLEAPATWEDLLATCETFRQAGIENPVTVSSEATWILASLADAAFRADEYDYLIQPDDALYDESTMSANKNFTWNPDDLACDTFTVTSDERQWMAIKDGSVLSEKSRIIWTEFAKLASYFPENYIASGADTVSEFEMQISPILVSGSWNVGLLIDDLNQMPEADRFDWATFNIPGFANAPEGFESKMRALYTLGNVMGIIMKDDEDHAARVLDFYLYWYSQAGAQLCYEETLSNGNYVQGPSMIKGVVLSDALNEKLAGFVVEGQVKQYFSSLVGQDKTTEADRPEYNNLINKFVSGEIDIDTFLTDFNVIVQKKLKEAVDISGYDFDPSTNP